MKSLIVLGLSALALVAGAAPAFADGPWGPPGPPPGPYADAGYGPPACERCMPPPPPCDCAPVQETVSLPTEFFDGAGGVGPDAYALDTGGGGGEIVESTASASAFASASASANVRVREIIRQHQRYQPHRSSCGCSSGKKW